MTDTIIGKIKFILLSKSRYFDEDIKEASQFTVFWRLACSRIIVSTGEIICFQGPKLAQIISGLLVTLYFSLQRKVLLLPVTDVFSILTNLKKIILLEIRQMYNSYTSV